MDVERHEHSGFANGTRLTNGTRHVNGPRLRAARLELGWTQSELARRSGYSERLIRKAEASETVRVFTLSDLARTLLEAGLTISVADLTLACIPPGLLIFYQLCDLPRPDQFVADALIADKCTLLILRPPAQLPLQREYANVSGLQRLRQSLRTRFIPMGEEELVTTGNGSSVFATLPLRDVQNPGAPPVTWITAFAFDQLTLHLFFT